MHQERVINFARTLAGFSEHWSPRIVARMNECDFKLVKLQGEFIWHSHPETDEVFIVLAGRLQIDIGEGSVALQAGEMFVVPRGVSHRPHCEEECSVLLVEPAGTRNTGDAGGERTAPDDVWA